jgi:uncharacterized damage-inducible protein DinB
MTSSGLLVACAVLFSAQSISAQSGGGAADPISGIWTGDIGLTLTNRNPVKFELKYDGTAITGTVTGPGPAEFKSGTFDPTTGALRLEVDVKGDGASARFVFEGVAVNGMATGRVNDGKQIGSFRITKVAAETAAPSPASGGDLVAELRRSFAEVSGNVSKAADLVPADKYSYRPAPSVRTFGQLVAHIADSFNYYCARAGGRTVQWSDPIEKGSTDKATLVQKLRESLDTCTPVYSGTGQIGPLVENLGHTNLHYGNIITYLRTLGLVPPSS